MTRPDFLDCPFRAHKIQLGAGDVLTYWSVGARNHPDGSPRPVLVAVHGMRDVGRSLAPIAHELAEEFYVVAPDLRGHGDSLQPGSYAIAHYLMDLRRVIQALEAPRVALLGHSLGGHICCRYAGVFTSEVSALIVIEGLGPPLAEAPQTATDDAARSITHSPPEEDPILLATRIDDAIATAEFARTPRVMPDRSDAQRRLEQNNPGLGTDYAMQLSEWLTTPADADTPGVRWRFDPCAQEVFLGISHNRNQDYWRRISAPTLIVFGDRGHEYWRAMRNQPGYDGRYSPQDLADRLACFQQVEHCTISNAGHQVHYDQPTQLASLCEEFLLHTPKPAPVRNTTTQ